jgi:hypothetical protein
MLENLKTELEVRRNFYQNFISEVFENEDYEKLSTKRKLEVISVVKSFGKLINKYQS